MITFNQLADKIKKNTPEADIAQIKKAYLFAGKHHHGQKRKDGTPFIQHPLEVAFELARFKFNTETFIAALLHDVVEDTKVTPDQIRREFGNEVIKLVSGVTKLSRIKIKKDLEEYSIENLRKMFLAMAQDIRVVLIKLADRYHNLKTLDSLHPKEKKRIARETMEIYAPLANRLGMGELKGKFEDLAFLCLYPKQYQWVKHITRLKIKKRQKCIEKIKNEIGIKLNRAGIDFIDIHGRAKHYFSLFRKLQRFDNNINNIYDLIALRVIVKTVGDCYRALGVIHQNWRPLLGRIKDYISIPKTSGYQSLHTTILLPEDEIVEIQIRTPKMHAEAEYGIAASWYYAEADKPDYGSVVPKKLAWINELISWQKELRDNKKFAEVLKIDFFKDRIFVFTPKGEVLDLPDGATPLDFAYHIHTEVGHHCKMVEINDKIAPLDQKLKNGDIVKVITSEKETPKRDWLTFIYTSLAQNRIKTWFKKQDRGKNLEYGKNLLAQKLLKLKLNSINKLAKDKIKIGKALSQLHYKTFDDLLIGIAQDDVNPAQIIKSIYSEEEILPIKKPKKYIFFGKPKEELKAKILGEESLLTNIAKCCNPSSSDKIVAHITRSKGASIHKADCPELKKFQEGRVVSAVWQKDSPSSPVDLKLLALDRMGLIKDVSTLLLELEININNLKSIRQNNGTYELLLTLGIKNIDQLVYILKKLEKIQGVLKVKRR
jgi:GTP pyrophosphokinase